MHLSAKLCFTSTYCFTVFTKNPPILGLAPYAWKPLHFTASPSKALPIHPGSHNTKFWNSRHHCFCLQVPGQENDSLPEELGPPGEFILVTSPESGKMYMIDSSSLRKPVLSSPFCAVFLARCCGADNEVLLTLSLKLLGGTPAEALVTHGIEAGVYELFPDSPYVVYLLEDFVLRSGLVRLHILIPLLKSAFFLLSVSWNALKNPKLTQPCHISCSSSLLSGSASVSCWKPCMLVPSIRERSARVFLLSDRPTHF